MTEKTTQNNNDQVQFAPLVFCPTCGLVLMDGADNCKACWGEATNA